MVITPQALGKRIEQARESRGWTLERVATRVQDECGVSVKKETIERWENQPASGKGPTFLEVVALARVFNLRLSWFAAEDEEEQPPESVEERVRADLANDLRRFLAEQRRVLDELEARWKLADEAEMREKVASAIGASGADRTEAARRKRGRLGEKSG